MTDRTKLDKIDELIDKADTYEGLIDISKVILKICVSEIADEQKKLTPEAKHRLIYLKTFERWTKIVKDAATKKDIEEVNTRLKELEKFREGIERSAKQ